MAKDDSEHKRNEHHAFWEQAFTDNYPRLRSYARRLTGDTDEALCVTHDAVCKVLKSSPDPARIVNTIGYLFTSVHNAWADLLKTKSKAKTISLDDPDNEEIHSELVAPDRDICIEFDNETYRRALAVVIKRLNAREKLLLQYFLEGYTCPEIAEKLNEDERLTRSDLNALRIKVKSQLTKGKAKTKGSGR
jgi:RNA polymerase sigma factor (sigma-70 family)